MGGREVLVSRARCSGIASLASTLSRARRREPCEEPSLPPDSAVGRCGGGRRRGSPRGCAQSSTGGGVCVWMAVRCLDGGIAEHRSTCRRCYDSATSVARSGATGVFLRLSCNSSLPCDISTTGGVRRRGRWAEEPVVLVLMLGSAALRL